MKRDNFRMKAHLMRAVGKKRLLTGQITMLTEKIRLMQREQNQSFAPLQADMDRINAEGENKRQILLKEREAYDKLKAKNDKLEKNGMNNKRICEYEAEIGRLERDLFEQEAARTEAQNKLDSTQRTQCISL